MQLNKQLYSGLNLFRKQQLSDKASLKLDLLWNWLEPIVLASIFWLLYKYKALNINSHYPYAFFVISGVLVWQSILDAINIPMNQLPKYNELSKQVSVQPLAIAFSFLYRAMYLSVARLAIVAALAIWILTPSISNIVSYMLFTFYIIIIFWGVGLFLAPFNAVLHDVSKATNIILRPLMFISAVLFPIPDNTALSKYLIYNPFYVLIESSRSILIYGKDSISLTTLLITLLVLSVISVIGILAFCRSMKWTLERI